MIVWLAVVLWLVIVAWSLALMRAAGSAEGKTKDPPERPVVRDPPLLRPSRRRSILFAFEALLLIASVTAAVLLSDAEQWQPPELVGEPGWARALCALAATATCTRTFPSRGPSTSAPTSG